MTGHTDISEALDTAARPSSVARGGTSKQCIQAIHSNNRLVEASLAPHADRYWVTISLDGFRPLGADVIVVGGRGSLTGLFVGKLGSGTPWHGMVHGVDVTV